MSEVSVGRAGSSRGLAGEKRPGPSPLLGAAGTLGGPGRVDAPCRLCSVHSWLLLGRGCLRIPPLDTDPIGADQAPPDSLILIVSQRPRLRTRSDSEVPGRGPHLVNGATFRPARVSPPASSSPSCVRLHGRLLCPASLILCAPPWPPCPPSHLPPPQPHPVKAQLTSCHILRTQHVTPTPRSVQKPRTLAAMNHLTL